ncbi:hypothetical protein V8F20_000996 [Naviculisporaceae sp. PSN 640]
MHVGTAPSFAPSWQYKDHSTVAVFSGQCTLHTAENNSPFKVAGVAKVTSHSSLPPWSLGFSCSLVHFMFVRQKSGKRELRPSAISSGHSHYVAPSAPVGRVVCQGERLAGNCCRLLSHTRTVGKGSKKRPYLTLRGSALVWWCFWCPWVLGLDAGEERMYCTPYLRRNNGTNTQATPLTAEPFGRYGKLQTSAPSRRRVRHEHLDSPFERKRPRIL